MPRPALSGESALEAEWCRGGPPLDQDGAEMSQPDLGERASLMAGWQSAVAAVHLADTAGGLEGLWVTPLNAVPSSCHDVDCQH